MFALLQVEPFEKKCIKRFCNMFKSSVTKIDYVKVKDSLPFAVVFVREKNNGIDWKDVKRCVGICAEKMILPEGVQPDFTSGIYKFVPRKYPLILMCNSLCKALEKLNNKDISLCVYDKYGVLTSKILNLVQIARYVTVCTDKDNTYKIVAERVAENCGASVNISPYENQAKDFDIILTDVYDFEKMHKCNFVFSAERKTEFSNLIYGEDVKYNICHQFNNVNSYDVLCALYELNGYTEIKNLTFEKLFYNEQEIFVKDMYKNMKL